MLACFHVQVQYTGQLQLYSLQRPKGKHNRSLKVAVQGLVLWPTPYTYTHTHTMFEFRGSPLELINLPCLTVMVYRTQIASPVIVRSVMSKLFNNNLVPSLTGCFCHCKNTFPLNA
jgi:hypothetical protein